jgi:hypothetical protein
MATVLLAMLALSLSHGAGPGGHRVVTIATRWQ